MRHVEVFFDPQGHTGRGVPFGTAIGGILAALEAGQGSYGISFKLIMCFLRHLDEQAAFATLAATINSDDPALVVKRRALQFIAAGDTISASRA